LAKNLAYEVLKVNLLVGNDRAFHVDAFDLYSARHRASYIAQAAVELGVKETVLKEDLTRVLVTLEQLQHAQIKRTLEPKPVEGLQMDEVERAAALALLTDPNLMTRILADFDACGVVGEETNKLVGYLASASRKLDRPLAVVIQSSSAAGKTSLMDAVLAFMPEEERVKYSAMTGQSLFYMGETNLKNKILAIAEEEGASRASYALKLLQSEGELTIASTGKDPQSGNLITQQYRVEGPVMIFLTTTASDLDEELLNRCLVLSVDEGREQTEAIHRLQRARRTLAGLIAKRAGADLVRLHQNAQRLLKPVGVMNPYADRLTFVSDKTRTRRDHDKYLTLIDTIAFLHQHQRVLRTADYQGQTIEYIEVAVADIALANRLAHEVLGRSLDELPPQTRRLLGEVAALVHARAKAEGVTPHAIRLSRKDVRDAVGWSDTQLRLHLDRLTELEYLTAHRDGPGGKFVYELVYDGDGGAAPHLSGLIDVATITEVAGANAEVAPPSRGGRGPVAGALRPGESSANPATARGSEVLPAEPAKKHVLRNDAVSPSYTQVLPLAAASR
jgi:hypothetical protein